MPIPSAPCGEAVEPCCVSLSDIANHLLAAVFDALIECEQPDCGAPVLAYVTMAGGTDGALDALTVSPLGVSAVGDQKPSLPSLHRAEFDVRLRESGWPIAAAEGDAIIFPDPEAQAVAARYVLSRGEAMHRRLVYMLSHHQLAPAGLPCGRSSVGRLTPLAPLGGVVGWTITVSIDLPWG